MDKMREGLRMETLPLVKLGLDVEKGVLPISRFCAKIERVGRYAHLRFLLFRRLL